MEMSKDMSSAGYPQSGKLIIIIVISVATYIHKASYILCGCIHFLNVLLEKLVRTRIL